ncbi:MAG: hypothetical protein IJK46_00550 [Prevotella sp.]|nr:hypothetical protein [Prevotella sp.]MBQ6682223.1 hypothetical protein [Prevotella sp.]
MCKKVAGSGSMLLKMLLTPLLCRGLGLSSEVGLPVDTAVGAHSSCKQ